MKLDDRINDSSEFFFLAISMLEAEKKTSVVPELLQILTPKQMVLMSHLLGGQTVRWPSTKDMSLALKAALYAYHVYFRAANQKRVREDLGASDAEFAVIQGMVSTWQERLKSEVGSELYTMVMR